MGNITHSRLSLATLALIAVISAFSIIALRWKGTISSDGRGYYAYLPSLFFDHDLSFRSAVEAEKKIFQSPSYAGNYINTIDGKRVNKYCIGEALLLAPFFLLACLLSMITGNPVDGYSYWFEHMVSIAALFYLLFGLNFIRKWLMLEAISEKIIAICLLLIFFATNLFEYTIAYPTMSHVYSFFAIAWFIYALNKYIKSSARISLFSAFIAFAFVVLIRPANSMVIVFLPFLAGDRVMLNSTFKKIIKDAKTLYYCILLSIVIAGLQLLSWYIQSGHFLIWSYSGEHFNFSKPELINFLFSYRKGLFIYTPLMFIACFGMINIYKENKFRFYSLVFSLFIVVYILSSWWNWYYGDSFGMRSMIDFYAVFAFMLAKLFSSLDNRFAKIAVATVACLTLFLNQVQAYQYNHVILHYDEMTKAKYWKVFLKTGDQYEKIFYHAGSEVPAELMKGETIARYKNDLESMHEGWTNGLSKEVANPNSGKRVSVLDANTIYSATLQLKDLRRLINKVPLILKGIFDVYAFDFDSASNVQMIVTIDSANGGSYFYSSVDISKSISANKTWQETTKAIYLPEINNPDDVLKFYIWNPKRKTFWLDNFDVMIVRP